MGAFAAKIIVSLARKLLTEALIARVTVYTLDDLAKRTTNQLDDKIVGAVADALQIRK